MLAALAYAFLLVNATPFAHVGLVPAAPAQLGAAAVLTGVGVLAAVAAIACFERRGLAGG